MNGEEALAIRTERQAPEGALQGWPERLARDHVPLERLARASSRCGPAVGTEGHLVRPTWVLEWLPKGLAGTCVPQLRGVASCQNDLSVRAVGRGGDRALGLEDPHQGVE